MLKIILLTTIFGLSVARPGGLGGHGALLGGSAYGVGGHGLGILSASSGISTSSRADVFGPSIAYSAGAPFPGAAVSLHGINAGIAHSSAVALATPAIGTVATGYGGHGYGGLGGHILGGHY